MRANALRMIKLILLDLPPQVIGRILRQILHTVSLKFFPKNLHRLHLPYMGNCCFSHMLTPASFLFLWLPQVVFPGGISTRTLHSSFRPLYGTPSTRHSRVHPNLWRQRCQPASVEQATVSLADVERGQLTLFSVVLHLQSENNLLIFC